MKGKGPAGFTQQTEYTDFLGQAVHEGDTVIYAALSGRSCQLVEATVIGIANKSKQVQIETQYDWKIQLQPTGRSGRWRQHGWRDTDAPKIVWVMAEQVIKAPPTI